MTPKHRSIRIAALAIFMLTGMAFAEKPLKVFILAGQSNMQGSAHMDTFAALSDRPETAPLAKLALDADGKPAVAENAFVTYTTDRNGSDVLLKGKVKVGYGFDDQRIGPEYGFGLAMDAALDEPVLIIKAAWGGKSLAVDFRPPSAGPYVPADGEKQPAADEVGHYYREMMAFVKSTLADSASVREVVPGYDVAAGYELGGFVWFQGWNDLCNRHHTAQYTANLVHLIADVRKELKAPALPFVVGVLGVYGADPDSRRFDKGLPVSAFRKEQFAVVAEHDRQAAPELHGSVVTVDSGPFYDLELSDIYWKRRLVDEWKRNVAEGRMSAEDLARELKQYDLGDGMLSAEEQRIWDRRASNAEYHYLGSGATFIGIGKAFADALLGMDGGVGGK